jgi:hypothetical protein
MWEAGHFRQFPDGLSRKYVVSLPPAKSAPLFPRSQLREIMGDEESDFPAIRFFPVALSLLPIRQSEGPYDEPWMANRDAGVRHGNMFRLRIE